MLFQVKFHKPLSWVWSRFNRILGWCLSGIIRWDGSLSRVCGAGRHCRGPGWGAGSCRGECVGSGRGDACRTGKVRRKGHAGDESCRAGEGWRGGWLERAAVKAQKDDPQQITRDRDQNDQRQHISRACAIRDFFHQFSDCSSAYRR